MQRPAAKFILGSRSPRRFELLKRIVPSGRVEVLPPRTAEEPGFGDLTDLDAIEQRLLDIARMKDDDVCAQLIARRATPGEDDARVIITADTAIIVTGAAGQMTVLGQPPADDSWKDTVRRWFQEYYAGKTHLAATAVRVSIAGRPGIERVVKSQVTFRDDVAHWLEWYLDSGEPQGKAGGYAIQEAGSIFVSRVEGSLSNVVGLPLAELLQMFDELGVESDAGRMMRDQG